MKEDYELLVVGSGPHALTCCTYLLQQRPALRERLLVVDPEGWLTCWNRQFDALGIDRLRSHVIDHPDPDPYALWRFAQGTDKEMGPYSAPGVTLFARFCRALIARHGLAEVLKRGKVEHIADSDQGVCAVLTDGTRLVAQRMVLATNTRVPRIPDWARDLAAQAPAGHILHTDELDLREIHLAGEHVLVVGGGLTAGQLTLSAVGRGATITLVGRGRVSRQVFDFPGGWLTPTELRGFYAEPAAPRRLEMVRAARRSTMTPAVAAALEEANRTGTVHLLEGCPAMSARWDGDRWLVSLGERTEEFHRIWLATGTTPRVGTGSLLGQLAVAQPIEMADGLPMLDAACRWPRTEIHVMGALAALQLGPAARNLAGARMAAERIASCIAPLDRYQYVQPTRPKPRSPPDSRAPVDTTGGVTGRRRTPRSRPYHGWSSDPERRDRGRTRS